MKPLVTGIVWFLLLVFVEEANRLVYNHLYFPLYDPLSGTLQYGSFGGDMILLSALVVTFFLAGAAIAWRMKGAMSSIISAMFLGTIWIGLQMSVTFPWFQLMANHPAAYDYVIAVVGASAPASAAALGALAYRKLGGKSGKADAT